MRLIFLTWKKEQEICDWAAAAGENDGGESEACWSAVAATFASLPLLLSRCSKHPAALSRNLSACVLFFGWHALALNKHNKRLLPISFHPPSLKRATFIAREKCGFIFCFLHVALFSVISLCMRCSPPTNHQQSTQVLLLVTQMRFWLRRRRGEKASVAFFWQICYFFALLREQKTRLKLCAV